MLHPCLGTNFFLSLKYASISLIGPQIGLHQDLKVESSRLQGQYPSASSLSFSDTISAMWQCLLRRYSSMKDQNLDKQADHLDNQSRRNILRISIATEDTSETLGADWKKVFPCSQNLVYKLSESYDWFQATRLQWMYRAADNRPVNCPWNYPIGTTIRSGG